MIFFGYLEWIEGKKDLDQTSRFNLDLAEGSTIGTETKYILARPKEEGGSGSSGVTTEGRHLTVAVRQTP